MLQIDLTGTATFAAMNDRDRDQLEAFFRAIEANLPGYSSSYFGYLALRRGDAFELTQGRVWLPPVSGPIAPKSLKTANVRAGVFRLAEVAIGPTEFVRRLLGGKVATPEGELDFPRGGTDGYSVNFVPLHMQGVSEQVRRAHLIITGGPRQRPDAAALDWELKGAESPYSGLEELCADFHSGRLGGDFVAVEVIAFPVAAIARESGVRGTEATLMVDLAVGLDKRLASIGYRALGPNGVIRRGLCTGSELRWNLVDGRQRGVGRVEVQPGVAIDCIASYAGVAQSHWWVSDPASALNPARSVHDLFDSNLRVLTDVLSSTQSKGGSGRELEVAVSWLLWMLGFSVTPLGGTARTSDGPDLVASTPRGDLLVIECTTGILKEDSKLSHLFQRAESVRSRLKSSGNQNIKVLPIIVTTRSREEVKPDLDTAQRHGIVVIAREKLLELAESTQRPPEPMALYGEAEDSLRRSQDQLQKLGHGVGPQ